MEILWLKIQQEMLLQFDGVDDYVNVTQNASLDITDNVSLEALIKPISIDTFERIIFKGSGDISAADFAYVLGVNGGTNSIYFGLVKNSSQTFINAGGGLITGQWQQNRSV